MNFETYEALQRAIAIVRQQEKWAPESLDNIKEVKEDLNKVESWIDEVAKEYESEV